VRKDKFGVISALTLLSGAIAAPVSSVAQTAPAPTVATQTNIAPRQEDVWYENYKFRSGQTLSKLRLHYATLGSPHRGADGEIDNAVLVLHWTGQSGATMLGQSFVKALYEGDRPLDASRYYLIFPDSIGHGRSSKPSDGLKAEFPRYGYGDMVDLQHRLVTETLGIKRLHAILGVSMGGMNAWQWAEEYPHAVGGIMPVVAFPAKISGRNLLWRRMAVKAIESDPTWKNGNYTDQPRGVLEAFSLLRLMIDGVPRFQREIPDEMAADKVIASVRQTVTRLDANDFLYSLKSSLDYDAESGLEKITAKVYALNFGDDEFNPPQLQILERLMPRVKNGKYAIQPASDRSSGHLTMASPELWADHVAEFLKILRDKPAAATTIKGLP
jgi:homoserine O-acetyltransferase